MTINELIERYKDRIYNTHNNLLNTENVIKDLERVAEDYKRTHILLVEDGSVDDEDLEEIKTLGYKVIAYRQGANKPEIIGK